MSKRALPRTPSELIERLERRKVESADELRRRLKRAQKAVAAKIEAMAAQQASAVSKRARDQLYAHVTSIYEVTAAEIDAWMKDQVTKTADEWHAQAVKDMRTLTGQRVLVSFSRDLVRRIWEIVHGGNQRYLAGVFTDKMADTDLRHLRAAFVDTFRQQTLEGWTTRETHKALQAKWDQLARNLSSNRFVDAAGRRWDNADYLNMLTRTTFSRVQDEAYVDALTAEGYRLGRIVDDGEPCPVCRAWAGLIVDLSGNQKTHYPSRKQAIDSGWKHPRCGCRIEFVSPTVDKADIDRQRRQPAATWSDPASVQAYNDDIRIREKRDAGMTAAAAERDLRRDKLRRELRGAGLLRLEDAVADIPDAVLDQMSRTGIPRIERAKAGDAPNSSRNSSLGGVLHLDPKAKAGQFRRALYTLEAKRGVRVADWRGLPAATDEDTAIGHFALFKDTVTPGEKAAILAYTHPGPTHRRWNAALRTGDDHLLTETDRVQMRDLDGVLEKAPRYDGVTYRGIPLDAELMRVHGNYRQGDNDVDRGFRSTSLSKSKGLDFAGTGPRALQSMHGHTGVPLFNFSAIEEEKEVLFKRESAMRVLTVSQEGTTVHEQLEEI